MNSSLNDTDLVERLRKLNARLKPGADTVGKPETRMLIIEAIEEIMRLREYEWMYKDLCK